MPIGLKVIQPSVFGDERGYFFESYNKGKILLEGIDDEFVQDNESCSCKNVIRGLHYQLEPNAQSKLVRVVKGSVIDFVLDIRKSSATFGKMYFIHLSGDNHRQFYVPHGFAHGFISLSDDTVFAYKCDNYYSKKDERGISIFDEKLNLFNNLKKFAKKTLNLNLNFSELVISDKDKIHPSFEYADLFN